MAKIKKVAMKRAGGTKTISVTESNVSYFEGKGFEKVKGDATGANSVATPPAQPNKQPANKPG